VRSSSHHFGVADAIEPARSLDRLPQRLVVYAIEGEDFGAGRELSEPVARAVEAIAGELG
jgi:hydrogenase maturation protease